MRIFIMRHAEAEMMAQSDKARQLTARGRQQSLSQGESFPAHTLAQLLHLSRLI